MRRDRLRRPRLGSEPLPQRSRRLDEVKNTLLGDQPPNEQNRRSVIGPARGDSPTVGIEGRFKRVVTTR